MISKVLRMLSLLPLHPMEFYDRLDAVARVHLESSGSKREVYRPTSVDNAIRVLEGALGSNWKGRFAEPTLGEIDRCIHAKQAQITADMPVPFTFNGDPQFAQFCYAATRSLRPRIIVETGVCYGVTSTHLLWALEINGEGCLHSIDLPPLGKNADACTGCLIPEELRNRWTLHRGTSRRLMQQLLCNLGGVDLFVHDSLHTYANMQMEFSTVWPALRSGGVLISDDVHGNMAFHELERFKDVAVSVVIETRERESLLGIAVKRS